MDVQASDVPLSPFLPGTKIQYAWDSTSIGYLKTCPRLYQLVMVEGWAPKDDSVHLRFGQEYHSAIEVYDKLKAQGESHKEAMENAILHVMINTADFDPDTESRAGKYKNRRTLIQILVDYFDKFEHDPATTFILDNGKPAVELSFKFELGWGPRNAWKPQRLHGAVEPDPQPYLLCGHLDRVVEFNKDLYVLDHKAQPLTTSVLGYNGWVQIGDLGVGDKIAGKDGQFYPVINIYHKGKTKVYRISFNDRTSVLCGEDHVWSVAKATSDYFINLTIKEMLEAPHYEKFHVPLSSPIQHPLNLNLPMDAYVLGALLGDGYLAGHSIVLSSQDRRITAKVEKRLWGDRIRENPHPDSLDWVISGGRTLKAIRELGLYGSLSRDKFIPIMYLFAGESQRRDLLDGLMDTDGSLSGHIDYGWRYKSMSLYLIEGVCELVRSLGGTARYSRGANGCYQASLRLPEWGHKPQRRYITAIEEVEPEATACIEVDSPDHLYVTENHTVTHNTTTTTPSSYYFDGFNPDNQMTLYTFASQVVYHAPVKGVIVEAAQIKLVEPNEFKRGVTYRTQDQLDEWIADLEFWLAQAESFAEANYWPMNDTSCNKFNGCQFRGICSKSPHVRAKWLAADFVQKPKDQIWNPLRPR